MTEEDFAQFQHLSNLHGVLPLQAVNFEPVKWLLRSVHKFKLPKESQLDTGFIRRRAWGKKSLPMWRMELTNFDIGYRRGEKSQPMVVVYTQDYCKIFPDVRNHSYGCGGLQKEVRKLMGEGKWLVVR